ncbi:hypothetical protein Tco_0299381 [Tanacetum coccineum]
MNVWKTMVKRSGTDEEDEKSRLQKESHLFSRMKQAPAQTGMRSLGAMASTIHSMIKFPTANGITTMVTKKETLQECRRMEEAHGHAPERIMTHPLMKASEPDDSSIKKRRETQEEQRLEAGQPDVTTPRSSPLERKATLNEKKKDNNKMVETLRENKPPKKVAVHDKYLDQPITIGRNLSAEGRAELIKVLRKHADAFVWVLTDMTGIPRFVAEHELKTYPQVEPRVQQKRSIALDRRNVVKKEVEEWL